LVSFLASPPGDLHEISRACATWSISGFSAKCKEGFAQAHLLLSVVRDGGLSMLSPAG
jgi:hypothetical protein